LTNIQNGYELYNLLLFFLLYFLQQDHTKPAMITKCGRYKRGLGIKTISVLSHPSTL